MSYVFSVSLPRSGHHAIEMYLRAALKEKFTYCEFYTTPDCCKSIPCDRLSHDLQNSANMFMQKSHDHILTDPVPLAANVVLVQIREPIARIASNLELYIKTSREPYSRGSHAVWLAQELVYQVKFIRKWCSTDLSKRLLLKFEDLVREPASATSHVCRAAGISLTSHQLAQIEKLRLNSSGGGVFRERDVKKSLYHVPEFIRECLPILESRGGDWGYQLKELYGKERSERAEITSLVEGLEHFDTGDYGAAVEIFERVARTLDSADLQALVVQCFGRAGNPLEAGRRAAAAGERWPKHVEIVCAFADFLASNGKPNEAVNYLRAKAPFLPNKMRLREFLMADNRFRFLLEELQLKPLALTRQQVMDTFVKVLDRLPESDDVIQQHRIFHSVEALERSLMETAEYVNRLSRETVIDTFVKVLGRLPESDDVIQQHRKFHNVEELERSLKETAEYAKLLPREAVIHVFREMLRRDPENEKVIWEHRRINCEATLRAAIEASVEYRNLKST